MQTSFFKTILFASTLFLFVSGCGKEQATGGNASIPPNPITGVGLNQQSQQALTNYQDWYTSTTTQSRIPDLFYPIHNFEETREISVLNSESTCTKKPIYIFGFHVGYHEVCSYNSEPTSTEPVKRQVTINSTVVNKSSNPLLAALSSGQYGNLVKATESNYSYGKIFVLTFQNSVGQINEFTIDTGVHFAFNPVKSFEASTKKVTNLTDIEEVY